ncbi:MAG TPA: magnesium transporter [Dehalococcoidia bacterium]|nr:magnesium transporter [Dehalococcoidia bacterium]
MSSQGPQLEDLLKELRELLEAGRREEALARFNQLHPADQGEVLVQLAQESRREFFAGLAPDAAAEVLEHLEPEEAVTVSEGVASPVLSRILDEASPDVAADILQELSEDRSQAVLRGMQETGDVVHLMQHAQDTAGGVMIPGYPTLSEEITAGNALDQLRILAADDESVNTLFVVDRQQRLVGSLGVAKLALARPSATVGELADREVISVREEVDQEECARLMQRYDLSRLPVVDGEGRLQGVIVAEDMVDVVEEEATEDMYRMAGIGGERVFGPLVNSLRSRLPWLFVNVGTVFLAAWVIGLFESTIGRLVVLSAFLPVVAGQGGIGGTQVLTLVIRSMALGEVPRSVGLRLLRREVALGLINGAVLGLAAGLLAAAWKGIPMLGVVLGLAMLGNMMVAGLAGAGMPLLLRRLRLDPAVSSAVFVTTCTDVAGFVMLLGLATVFIHLLL